LRPLEEEVDEVVDKLGEGGWELAEFLDRGVLDGHRYASQDEVLENIWIKYSTDNLLDLSSDRWSTTDYRSSSMAVRILSMTYGLRPTIGHRVRLGRPWGILASAC
jgi:hypothetical protein